MAMVGDGINDAPVCPHPTFESFALIILFQALTAADVGIAMGSGSDIALSSADFVLLSSNLQTLLILTGLSRKVLRRVKFNFVSFLPSRIYICLFEDLLIDKNNIRAGQPCTTS